MTQRNTQNLGIVDHESDMHPSYITVKTAV